MPSSVAHGLSAAALAALLSGPLRTRKLLVGASVGAIVLDVDAIGRPFGLGDLAFFGGHRALTHSVAFAAFIAALLTLVLRRSAILTPHKTRLWACLAIAIASHGLLDAFTTYGDGVMLLAPFNSHRFRSEWQPLDGMIAEALWLWIPTILILVLIGRARSSAERRPNEELKPTAAPSNLVE